MSEEKQPGEASEETIPDTSLHAYKEGREDDVEGNVDKLKEGDPQDSQRAEIAEGDEESNLPNPEKH